jgi:ribosomal-protein-alanine N-acetyltransferase
MRLHRIMANHRPENVRSARLLERLGFVREGVAKDFLFIDGAWCDHVLTSLTHGAFDPAWIEPAGK